MLECVHRIHGRVPLTSPLSCSQLNKDYSAHNRKSGTRYVRHRNVGRAQIVLYDVSVFAVKLPETANTPATTAVSISLESLKRLSAIDPTIVLPEPLPMSHCSDKQATRNRASAAHPPRANQQTEAVRRSSAVVPPRRPPQQQQRKRRRRVVQSDSSSDEMHESKSSSDESSSEDSSVAGGAGVDNVGGGGAQHDDNEQPDPPSGYEITSWKEGDKISNFMVWTSIDSQSPKWHRGQVVKALRSHRRYTHDVTLDGSTQKRGIALETKGYADGCWVAIAPKGARPRTPSPTEPPHSPSPRPPERNSVANADVPTVERRVRARVRVLFECSKCRRNDYAFLYCPANPPDGVPPPLCCVQCAPRGWVSLSRTDYERSL